MSQQETNIFEQASRMQLRFEVKKVGGLLTVEDLWKLRLIGRDSANLDAIARELYHQIKEFQNNNEISFVSPTKTNNRNFEILKLKFEIVQHIIKVRLEEKKIAEQQEANSELKRKIQEALLKKQDEAFENKSAEELQEMLKSL